MNPKFRRATSLGRSEAVTSPRPLFAGRGVSAMTLRNVLAEGLPHPDMQDIRKPRQAAAVCGTVKPKEMLSAIFKAPSNPSVRTGYGRVASCD